MLTRIIKYCYSNIRKFSIPENELSYTYQKGGGKGGQKVNKTNNCVILTHLPT